jgi:hypothetical protein
MVKLLRFADLVEMGVCKNWTQLKRLQVKFGFPTGRMVGGTRTWTDAEIAAWYETCPVEGPPLRGDAKARHERALRKREQQNPVVEA